MEAKPVNETSKRKVFSALRYLRLGTEAAELENKLLNYWIAIEYLFSSVDTDEGKVIRLREFLKKIHSISYASKLFRYTDKAVSNLNLSEGLSNYDPETLEYLIADQTISELSHFIDRYPLSAFRAYTLQKRFKDLSSIKQELERHQANIERNIVRIYRTRNEIVHSAAHENNILDITSHLRYYLTFVINGFLDFALNNPIDLNNDGNISIEDYFNTMAVQLDNLLTDKSLSIQKLLKFKSPIEYLE